jgi:phospholipase C
METRRDFMKAALMAGAAGLAGGLTDSIQRAFAIAPDEGSTFWDAEHVVILMQENRSFDHAFGALQGVRGFNDPRAIKLTNGSPVWVQTNKAGESYLPFRLDINKTNATWMGSIPHGWTDQVDARNGGLYDGWLDAKRSGDSRYADMPLTMGYYTREDIPFYYDFADAFTICDQNFCSSLTGTTPNRLHLWTGTIRPEQVADAPAMVLNSDVDYPSLASWTTFPERLEDAGIPWKVYQNELSVGVGFEGEEDPWLANFTDNPLEFFSQYHVNLAAARCRYLQRVADELAVEVERLKKLRDSESGSDGHKVAEAIKHKEAELAKARTACREWNADQFEQLSPREKSLHNKAFDTNCDDPDYHTLTVLKYQDDQTDRHVQVPKGDVLYQFRKDVSEGKLPTVSWVVPPERFSDHPCSAWYGAWYIAEMLDILTANPEVWKKTIFILTYDENDGYFDHVPPFVTPHPHRPETGKASPGIDVELEYVEREQELKRKPADECRDSPIGLGYRVPMIVASPWTRGGCVCSQVFDHTSSLQFLEKFLTHKTGTPIVETNINSWRRTVCGDLTSVFQPALVGKENKIVHPTRDEFIEQIHRAQFMNVPTDYRRLSPEEIQLIRRGQGDSALMPRQEAGVRKSCAIPYELAAEGQLATDRKSFSILLAARNQKFGQQALGAPFIVYSRQGENDLRVRNYTVAAGTQLDDSWPLANFADSRYELVVYGPNGFFREFRGDATDPAIDVRFESVRDEELVAVAVHLQNRSDGVSEVEVADLSYNNGKQTIRLARGEEKIHLVPCERSFGWYDVRVRVAGSEQFVKRYAGRVETGAWSFTDPAMGGVVV